MLDDLLRQVEALRNENKSLQKEATTLRCKKAELEEVNTAIATKLKDAKRKNRELLDQLQAFIKRLYGRKTEKIDPHQLLMHFDEKEVAELAKQHPFAEEAPDAEEETDTGPPKRKRKKRSRAGRQPLPEHLPRERLEHTPGADELVCPCCNEEMTRIGEEKTEELDFRPASFFVREHVRPKFACRRCPDEGVRTADLPPRPIDRGRPGTGLLAHILTAKYADHLPLYRLERIARREGVELSRSTMCDWIRDGTFLLEPIVQEMKRRVLASHVIQTDDTPVKMQDNWRGAGIRQCYLWSYVGDEGDIVFDFTRTRAGKWPSAFLEGFDGYVQADAYSGYNVLYSTGRIVEVGCWAHARRKFHDAMDFDPGEAARPLALIQLLYRVEKKAKEEGLDADALYRLRKEESTPILASLREELDRLHARPQEKDPLAKAVSYTLDQWDALGRYIDDPRLAIDNNRCERSIRGVAVGRRNWLFCGSEGGGKRAAIAYSIIESAKLQELNIFEYLRDVFERVSSIPQSRVAELTPRGWKENRRASEQQTPETVAANHA